MTSLWRQCEPMIIFHPPLYDDDEDIDEEALTGDTDTAATYY